MKTCFLHAGPHKTGSTSLQHMIDDNPGILTRRGLFAPKLSNTLPLTKGHAMLLPELRHMAAGDMDRAPHWKRLSIILGRTRMNPFITGEVFSVHLMTPALRAAVVAFFARHGYRLHLIYVLRDHPAWINSTYVQETKKFYTAQDFPAYLAEALHKPRFDVAQMIGPLIDARDHDLTVLSFADALRQGLLDAVLTAAGVARCTPDEAPAARRDNPNAGAKAVHVGRRVAARLRELGLDGRRAPGIYGLHKAEYLARGWFRTPFMGLDAGMAAQVRAQVRPGADDVARAIWGRPWADVFPPDDRAFVPCRFDPASASAADLADVAEVEAQLLAMAELIAALGQGGG